MVSSVSSRIRRVVAVVVGVVVACSSLVGLIRSGDVTNLGNDTGSSYDTLGKVAAQSRHYADDIGASTRQLFAKGSDDAAGVARGADNTAGAARNAKACSFDGSTVVLMADGTTKPIDQVQAGDEVIASDPATGEQGSQEVVQVFVHEDTLSTLVTDTETIVTTEDHPWWNVTDQAFERTDELDPGDKLLSADGTTATVIDLKTNTAQGLAYNLEITTTHTYHVGTTNLLVHNKNTCDVDVPSFSDLTNSSHGIAPYSAQRKITAGHGGEIHAHHLIEKRFRDVVGQNSDDMLSIIVTQTEHRAFTNAWRNAIPHRSGKYKNEPVDPSEVVAAARRIYSNSPEILRELGL
jgi:hypothetical protein